MGRKGKFIGTFPFAKPHIMLLFSFQFQVHDAASCTEECAELSEAGNASALRACAPVTD
jgi:hypothetical protein